MFIVCAPDSFKGTINAADAAAAMARAAIASGHEAIALPVADGGEGTGAVLVAATDGIRHAAETVDPMGRPIEGHWYDLGGGSALVESAVASGLGVLGAADRQPMQLSSVGTGLLIDSAMTAGAETVFVAVGGTGTVDGGCGLLQAIGVDWLDSTGTVLGPVLPPSKMHTIKAFRQSRAMPNLVALVDTTAPLLGPTGAAQMFAPQKGASDTEVEALEGVLTGFAHVIDTNGTVQATPGTGAGGGMGFAIAAFGGCIRSGAEFVLETLRLDDHLANADLVLTGEGCMDGQTASGKAPLAVARAAAAAGVPCVAIVGMLGDGYESLIDQGVFLTCTSLLEHVPIEEAMGDPAAAIERVTKTVSDTY